MQRYSDRPQRAVNPLFALVGIPYVVIGIKQKGKEARRFLESSNYILTELVSDRSLGDRYAVKPEALAELQSRGIRYEELLHYPMSQEVRERVRANLKKKGAMGPV